MASLRIPGARPGRARRPLGLRQVDLCPKALQADGDPVVRLRAAASSRTTRTTSRSRTEAFEVLHFVARKRLARSASSRSPTRPTCSPRHASPSWRSRASSIACPSQSSSRSLSGSATIATQAAGPTNWAPTSSAADPADAALDAPAPQRRVSVTSSFWSRRTRSTPPTIERQPLWNNRRQDHGPFDVIGDVHGCFDELRGAP